MPATEPLPFGVQSASSSQESDTVLADDMALEENIEQEGSQEKLNMYVCVSTSLISISLI